MIDLQLVLFETLKQDSSRHQVWNIDKLYTRRSTCIKIEKKQHMGDKGEENIQHLIYISKNRMYVKKKKNQWSQDHGTCNEKRVHQNLTTSLKTLSPYLVYPMLALSLTTRLLSSIKLLKLFVTSDKGWIIERSSSHHHTQSQKHHHHHLHQKRTPRHA